MARNSKSSGPRRGPGRTRQVVAALLVVLLVIFVAQNPEHTRVDVLFIHLTLPLWLTLLGTALVGVAIGWLLGRRRR